MLEKGTRYVDIRTVITHGGGIDMEADYILKSNAIFDSVRDEPFPGIVVISGNKIEGVFENGRVSDHIGERTEVIDYGDKLIMPGFIDSHTHTGMAMDFLDESYCVDISSGKNFHEIMMIMKDYEKKYPGNDVVFGINFNLFELDEYFVPDINAMDEYFPDKAAIIMTWDVHTFFANSKAVKMAGITKDTPDPNGGIGKYENGELNGVFNDTAAFALQKIVDRPIDERKKSLKIYMKKVNSLGITSVGDLYPCGVTKPYQLYKEMEDKLSLRIHFYPELLSFTSEEVNEYKKNYSSDMLQFAGLKNLIDGVLTVYTAWMLEPYTNNPGTNGFPAVPAEQVREKMLEAISQGINLRIHTIGDQAVRYVLDVFEEAEKKYGRLDRRHNMEHIEYIDPEDIPRLEKLGIVANMHFRHCTFYIDEAVKYLGKEREKHCFNWRSILDTGATIGTGSDFPVVGLDPMQGVYAGVTRCRADGYPEGGWLPEQCLSLSEVLRAYTYGGACALNRDRELGTLESGKLADITVLDRNIFSTTAEELLETEVIMTMLDGRIVYKKQDVRVDEPV